MKKNTPTANMAAPAQNQLRILKSTESDSDINFFTAFPNYQTLLTCYNFLNPGTNGENIAYVSSVTDEVDFTCVSSIESTLTKYGYLNIWPYREVIDKAMP